MRRTSIWKRSLAALLSLVMVLGMIPSFGAAPVALAAEGEESSEQQIDDTRNTEQQTGITGNYITLPITIRDFAADGMLFEYNEVNVKTDSDAPTTRYETDYKEYSMTYNPSTWSVNDYKGLRILVGTTTPTGWSGANIWWTCIIIGKNGDVLKILKNGESKATYTTDMANAGYSVWLWSEDPTAENHALLAKITDANMHMYRFGFVDSDSDGTPDKLFLGRRYTKNGSIAADNKGIYIYDGHAIEGWIGGLSAYNSAWHSVVINASTHRVVDVVPKVTEDKATALAPYLNSSYKILMTWDTDLNADFRDLVTCITDETASEYYIEEDASTLTANVLNIDRSRTFHQADTQAFGLLQTDDNDYINNLNDKAGEMSNIIYGSVLFSNGSWNTTTEITTPTKSDLYSSDNRVTPYATQDIYGAKVRTNLVDKGLDVNGNPLYTPETVAFLAGFMQQIMAVPYKNEDGSYNTYHVEGVKLYDAGANYVGPNTPEAVYDLADLLRMSVKDNALGDYATAKAKFESRQLLYPHQANTWFEAAYYLLHSTWADSPIDLYLGRAGTDGYGFPIDRYNRMHLIETTNEDGQVCYVFNARFDETVYDANKGEIYNTQLTKYTQAVNGEGKQAYAYGNILPVARFDPLGLGARNTAYGLGYGLSGNTYGDMTGASATQDWGEFYNETNYNLSLEGHAQFVYHQDANQYFKFTGDDDVYLYINGVRVLDIGGAHSISKVGFKVNDIAEVCGLVDGGTYPFDFFFLERHGTAANFGIETNIQIAEPSMNTYKTGYQKGASTGYNGWVDPAEKVGYSFELQNDGQAHIYNLTFNDPTINVYFGWDNVKLNGDSNSKIEEMYMILWDGEGNFAKYLKPGEVTVDAIKETLANGLEPGGRIGIYGFKYKISDAEWNAGNGTFTNTVYTTSTTAKEITTPELNGMADWKVQKMAMPFTPFHVYDWVARRVDKSTNPGWYSPEGASVTVTQDEMMKYLKDYVKNYNENLPEGETAISLPTSGLTTVLCTASGNEDAYNLNPCAEVNSDGSITYTSVKPGLDTVFYKIKGTNLHGSKAYDDFVFNYDVYTYGAADNVYVLDYGLDVELAGPKYGFQVNDTLSLQQNRYGTTATINLDTGSFTKNYGTFAYDNAVNPISVKYKPNKIINDTDSFRVNIQILQTGATEVTKFTGVNMSETVTTAPASVVYYEENFPGITYVEEGENEWVQYETVDKEGAPLAGPEQSADQESNYGSDPNYEEDLSGAWKTDGEDTEEAFVLDLDTSNLNALQEDAAEAINEYLGLAGSDSNGTVKELVVKQTAEVMHFDFVGTGFEIISRTTDEQYAVINVQVLQDLDDDGVYETVYRQKPVITESIGGDLYQVPIISITGLPKGEYRVAVKAGTTGKVTRVLYIDGIRIYGPLDDDKALMYYNPEEYRAKIFEVKQLIKEGKATYQVISDTDGKPKVIAGGTLVEDQNGNIVLTEIYNVEEYMSFGPNNELYLDANGNDNLLAFWLKPIEYLDDAKTIPYPDAARTIQIGAHRKADSLEPDNKTEVNLVYSCDPTKFLEAESGDENFYSIASGTEMYYTIDVKHVTENPDSKELQDVYFVMIGTNGLTNEDSYDALALTNLKIAGYEFVPATPAIVNAVTQNTFDKLDLVQRPFAVLKARLEATMKEPEAEQIPVNENLTVDSAALRSTKVSSGKNAVLTVKAGAEAQTVVITDANGNVVEMTKCTRKVSGDVVTFSINWKVSGSRGDVQTYTIRVYDGENLASVNTQTVKLTVQ